MANKIRNTARNFHAPALPNPPAEYSQALTHQRDTALRIYFQSIDEAITQALQYDTSDIIDGSIPNSKLENFTVSFGGVTLPLGGSDATPAFDLSDATGYPTSSLVGTITTAQIADDAVTEAKLANSINSAIAANTAKVSNATHTGEVTGATALTIADGAVVTARIADDAVTGAKIAHSTITSTNMGTASIPSTAIQPSAVTSTKLADDAVTADKLAATNSFTMGELTVQPPSASAGAVIRATAATNYSAELHLGDSGDTDAGRIQYVNATGSMGFFVENSERMRIDSAGDVGIGITNPLTKLHVSRYGTPSGLTPTAGANLFVDDTSGPTIQFGAQWYGASNIYFGRAAGNGAAADVDLGSIVYSNYSNYMSFKVNASERMRIDSSGKMLIGTTSVGSYGSRLRVNGFVEGTSFKMTSNSNQIFNAGNYGGYGLEIRSFTAYNASYAQPIVKFAASTGTEYGSIKILGAATQYNTSSDERLKENIRDAEDAGDKIDAIKIRQFDWIDGEHQDYGVIAQELLPVAPEAVSKGYTEDDMMGVDYSKLVPTLIKEIQSLRKRVEELEKDK